MLTRLTNLYRPLLFQGAHRRREYFEGWYYKTVFAERAYAFIPGISLAPGDEHAFLQILDGRAGTASYHRFTREAFSYGRSPFFVSVGANRFKETGFTIATDDLQAEFTLHNLSQWPSTWSAPGAMGWYTFVPFMECYHGVIALDGEVQGRVNGTDLDQGRFYMEKDWGTSFPQAWIWLQTNNFENPGCSLTCSIATVPWLRGAFTGFIVGLLADGKLHRFTTYTGACLEKLAVGKKVVEIQLRRRDQELSIRAQRSAGADLASPVVGEMLGRVNETLTASAGVVLREKDRTLFAGTGSSAGLEVAHAQKLDGVTLVP